MIPEEIKRHRPKGTEIHNINGKYYVYKTTSVWDKQKKKPRKKTLGSIGKITVEDGFIPSKKKIPTEPVIVKEYGCYALFRSLLPEILEQLEDAFGKDLGRKVYAIAMVRLLGRATKAQVKRYYDGSWLSEELHGLPLSENTLTATMRTLGNHSSAIRFFLTKRLPSGSATILFDGTTILTASKNMSYACYGRSKKKQINLLYAFSRDCHEPVWYRLLPGNVADMTAFKLALEESGLHDCTVVSDKGFFSKVNVSAMDKAHIKYLLPLKSNTTLIDTEFSKDANTKAYDGCFEYHGRVIWHKSFDIGSEGKRVHAFRDEGKRTLMELNYVRRMEADYDGLGRQDLEEKKVLFGMSYIYTNTNMDAHDAYLTYKTRWEIEECFDYLKNGLDLGTVYQRTNEEAEAWAFLNHISLTMFYALYAALLKANLSAKWTPDAVITMAKNINRVKIGDTWITTEVSKKDREVLSALGVTLSP
jgi:transposase